MLDQITPLILTFNEAPNISRVLEKLTWARRVVVVDSFSDDETEVIARTFGNVDFVQRKFDSHSQQWDYGLRHTGMETEWVLALDADYVLTDALVAELAALRPGPQVAGYRAKFAYCINGRALRGALYTPVMVLYRRNLTSYRQDGHTQRACSQGVVLSLSAPILHDDRKPLDRWFSAQVRYMRLESAKILDTPLADLRLQDRVRRLIVVAPWAAFFYCLFAKRTILDGAPGIFYALQRSVAESILSLFILERMLSRPDSRQASG